MATRQRTMPEEILVWTLPIMAASVLTAAFLSVRSGLPWGQLVTLCVLGAVAEGLRVSVYLPGHRTESVSPGVAVLFAAGVTLGVPGAVAVAVVTALTKVILKPERTVAGCFNYLAAASLAAAAAAGILHLFLELPVAEPAIRFLIGGLAGVAVHFAAYTSLADLAGSLGRTDVSVRVRFGFRFGWVATHHILLGMGGVFVVVLQLRAGTSVAVAFCAAIVALRFTFQTYAHRIREFTTMTEKAKQEVEEAHDAQREVLDQLIEVIGAVIDARDAQVYGHSRRVGTYAALLAEDLKMPADEVVVVRTAGLLHDLGKVAIPEAILHKPDKLTSEEYGVVKQHAVVGERILMGAPRLAQIARMLGEHHEHYDGGGYPRGLKGEQISLGGRILAVADALDTITSDRPYARAKPLGWALGEIERCSGQQFDPMVVCALRRVVARSGERLLAHRTEGREPSFPRVAAAIQ